MDASFKASETLLGIETLRFQGTAYAIGCFKASETLLGIETQSTFQQVSHPHRFKASETLLGIETINVLSTFNTYQISASKPLKPF